MQNLNIGMVSDSYFLNNSKRMYLINYAIAVLEYFRKEEDAFLFILLYENSGNIGIVIIRTLNGQVLFINSFIYIKLIA